MRKVVTIYNKYNNIKRTSITNKNVAYTLQVGRNSRSFIEKLHCHI